MLGPYGSRPEKPMNSRSLTLIAVTTLVSTLALAGTARAKPSIAVLGLEVKNDGDNIDEQATKLASALTQALRKRATIPNGPYRLAPNSDKDLLELKLLSDCFDEGRECMSQMGKELKADRLLYGKIQRRKNGFQVSLDLLDVGKKTMERSTSEIIPFGETNPAGVKKWARSLYNRLTGVPELGSLVVTANVDNGTVYIDGEIKGSLSGGSARITGLAEGSHTVGIEADGYESFGGEVSITSGETEELSVDLVTKGAIGGGKVGGGKPGRPGRISRVLFWTSLVATGAGATAMTITGLQVRGTLKDDQLTAISALASRANNPIQLDSKNACADAEQYAGDGAEADAVISACDTGKSRATLTNVFLGATIVGALAASYFYYRGFVSADAASSSEKRSAVRIVPSLGPNQVGAGVTVEF